MHPTSFDFDVITGPSTTRTDRTRREDTEKPSAPPTKADSAETERGRAS